MRAKGVSLLEVLFAMVILLIGLLGVGAMIPAGRFEVLQGAKIDHASAIGRQAFRDLKVRRFLDPINWRTYAPVALSSPYTQLSADRTIPPSFATANASSLNSVTPCVVIDPLGIAEQFGQTFPYGASGLYLTRIMGAPIEWNGITTDVQGRARIGAVYDLVNRSTGDLEFLPSDQGRDFPPKQQWFKDDKGTDSRRLSMGNYSWIATVVSEPTNAPIVIRETAAPYDAAPGGKEIVTVAVFYKRDTKSPAIAEQTCAISSLNGLGEIVLLSPPKAMKPGQALMLAGTLTVGTETRRYFSWYRVIAADSLDGSGNQAITVHGRDWSIPAASTQCWLIDNVIATFEKSMKLEF